MSTGQECELRLRLGADLSSLCCSLASGMWQLQFCTCFFWLIFCSFCLLLFWLFVAAVHFPTHNSRALEACFV